MLSGEQMHCEVNVIRGAYVWEGSEYLLELRSIKDHMVRCLLTPWKPQRTKLWKRKIVNPCSKVNLRAKGHLVLKIRMGVRSASWNTPVLEEWDKDGNSTI